MMNELNMAIVFIEFSPGTIVERRVKLLHPGRRSESRRGASGTRDEGPRSDQNSRPLQIVSQMQETGDQGCERYQSYHLRGPDHRHPGT